MGFRLGHMVKPSDRGVPLSSGICFPDDAPGLDALRSTEPEVAEPLREELPGRVHRSRQAEWIELFDPEHASHREQRLLAAGLCSGIGIPVIAQDGGVAAVIELYHEHALPEDAEALRVLVYVATQLGYVWDRDHAARRIRALAYSDELTGLPNRQRFQRSLEGALEGRRSTDSQVALLFLDLDGFKRVNDTLGHAMGDLLLREVAERFKSSVRATDVIGRDGEAPESAISRLGGDEFTVLLTGIRRPEDAGAVARRMLQSLEAPIALGETRVFVSASIGIALHPSDGKDAITLLKHADTAMYEAKARGRGQFQYFRASMNAAGEQRVKLEHAVRHALATDGFELNYQPVRNREGGISGTEALLRMRDPEGQPVGPDQFIPVAEECGLIAPVGDWVLHEACRQLREWRNGCASGSRPLRMAVNVSAHQLRLPGFADSVKAAIQRYGLDPTSLELELTETAIATDDEHTARALATLDALGVGLALDDFGTGYSAISYLRRFPIHRVKIDRSFVSEIPDNPDDCRLVDAIIAMAHGCDVRSWRRASRRKSRRTSCSSEAATSCRATGSVAPCLRRRSTRCSRNSATDQGAASAAASGPSGSPASSDPSDASDSPAASDSGSSFASKRSRKAASESGRSSATRLSTRKTSSRPGALRGDAARRIGEPEHNLRERLALRFPQHANLDPRRPQPEALELGLAHPVGCDVARLEVRERTQDPVDALGLEGRHRLPAFVGRLAADLDDLAVEPAKDELEARRVTRREARQLLVAVGD